MEADRPEKRTVRAIWTDKTVQYFERHRDDEGLFYLTLPGADGRDVQHLADRGIIALTEVGGIADESQGRFAAVENSVQAIGALQRRFPGLKIHEAPFQSLVRGDGLLRFPEGDDERLCRARVINLDLNSPLNIEERNGEFIFPTLMWVKKLGQIHAAPPRRTWNLYLTLHAEIIWPVNASQRIGELLSENFESVPEFGAASRTLLGDEIYNTLSRGNLIDFSSLNRKRQQELLMILVPKAIMTFLQDQHWKIDLPFNLRYGRSGHAPMVTWIFEFGWDETASGNPNALYRDNLSRALEAAGQVNHEGEIQTYA